MSNLKFSIIIPIYKVENYLDRCVTSAINQTYKNIEVVLVDDGSPDKCPEMCDDYARCDDRIKVIHKTNGGLSDARNAGLLAACGDYVIFLDSDDTIEENCCEKFLSEIEYANMPDVVVGCTNRLEGESKIVLNEYSDCREFSGVEFLNYVFSEKSLFSMIAPNNVYRRLFLIENKFFFEKGILHEDERWTPVVLLKAQSVVNANIPFYNYYIRSGSITTTNKKRKNALDLINTVFYLKDVYEHIENQELKQKLMDYLVSLYLNAIFIGDLQNEKEYIHRDFVLKNASSFRNKIKSFLFSVSPRLYCYINSCDKK